MHLVLYVATERDAKDGPEDLAVIATLHQIAIRDLYEMRTSVFYANFLRFYSE